MVAARMAELLPAQLTRRPAVWANAVIVVESAAAGSPATLLLRRNRQETSLGVFIPNTTNRRDLRAMLNGHAEDRVILLRLPPGARLEKQLVLPIVAERELRRVIGYEINRVTPFEVGDVFWTWTVTKHDRPRGRLHIRLSLVPKAALVPLLAALDQAGLSPTSLEATSSDSPPDLIPLRQNTERVDGRRRVAIYLASVCGVLAVVAVSLPFLLQSLALGEVEGRIAAVQAQVEQVQALRQRVAAESASRDALADERLRVGNALEILAAVTALLPDNTFLNDLTLRQRRLTISGQSATAAKLIAGLASGPMFRNPAFAAPVTRNEVGRTDVFSIRAEVGF
jgi:general secretion pathway protein L